MKASPLSHRLVLLPFAILLAGCGHPVGSEPTRPHPQATATPVAGESVGADDDQNWQDFESPEDAEIDERVAEQMIEHNPNRVMSKQELQDWTEKLREKARQDIANEKKKDQLEAEAPVPPVSVPETPAPKKETPTCWPWPECRSTGRKEEPKEKTPPAKDDSQTKVPTKAEPTKASEKPKVETPAPAPKTEEKKTEPTKTERTPTVPPTETKQPDSRKPTQPAPKKAPKTETKTPPPKKTEEKKPKTPQKSVEKKPEEQAPPKTEDSSSPFESTVDAEDEEASREYTGPKSVVDHPTSKGDLSLSEVAANLTSPSTPAKTYASLQKKLTGSPVPNCNLFVAVALIQSDVETEDHPPIFLANSFPKSYLIPHGWKTIDIDTLFDWMRAGKAFNVILQRTRSGAHGHISIPVGLNADGRLVVAEGTMPPKKGKPGVLNRLRVYSDREIAKYKIYVQY